MRKRLFKGIFSCGTALNILILRHIHTAGVLRAGIEDNYITPFSMWDVLAFIIMAVAVYCLIGLFSEYGMPFISKKIKVLRIGSLERYLDRGFGIKIFGLIFVCWFFFFLVFYPGSAMNDTINICNNPSLLTNQHPAMYVYYTYAFYRLGVAIGNPNIGLAILSLFQMICMDYVITYAIRIFHREGASVTLCMLVAVYFGIAPLFSTYAVSAIKDTPFAIAVFLLMVMLYEDNDFGFRFWICVFIMAGFRSNGILIAAGTGLIVVMIYKRYRKRLAIIFATSIVAAFLLNLALTPSGVDKLFQEKIGIPLQQVAAVVNKGSDLTDDQKQYLFRLLPEEKWSDYGTGCVDNIKWNVDFDREFLNETKGQFIDIWLELLPGNIGVYTEAYILNTYGIWGIETRNGEQYYEKEIYNNSIGLYQDSPLPRCIAKIFYTYYCNRFTYRYLSEGTSFWVMFGMILWLLYERRYTRAVVFTPMAVNFATLMVATPIAFAFRYVFTMALIFPFMILMPFIRGKVYDYTELDKG